MSGGITNFETMNSRRRRDAPSGHVVQAQPMKDSSYMESMVNFFHDIGQVYSNTSQAEEKETVLWARLFDYKNALDPEFDGFTNGSRNDVVDSLLLILGYKNGVQAWIICENGEVQEILSLREGPVKTACLVPPPSSSSDKKHDEYTISRPLLAVCMAADRKQLFTSVSIFSLRTKDKIRQLEFDENVEELSTGLEGMIIVTLRYEIKAFNTFDFKLIFTVRDCYPSPGVNSNPIAVGNKWLAYSPAKLLSSCQSAGGMEDDGINSYAATVINAAKTIKKGIVNLKDTVNWLAKTSMTTGEEHSTSLIRETTGQRSRNQSGGSLPELSDGVPGLVTVLDISKLCENSQDDNSPTTPEEPSVNGVLPEKAIVAHFPAHSQPVVCMKFSNCGSLIATADKRGHSFHVFSILPHPVTPRMGAVHHIYSLYRGDTSARVQEISFSGDSRWLSVSTLRGTSHIFPIAAYGGAATVRTHASHRVVNRSSRFHKSAGLEDLDPTVINVGGSNHSVIDSGSPIMQVHARRGRTYSGSRAHNSTNPRLPPHPKPTLVQPLAQIGSSRAQHVLNLHGITGQTQSHSSKTDKTLSNSWQADIQIASVFTSGQLKISRTSGNHDNALRRAQMTSSSKGGQCLLIFNSGGYMTEYHLEPRPQTGLSKISDDSPIELVFTPRYQWPLQRILSWNEVNLPLSPTNALLEVDNKRRLRIKTMQEISTSSSSSLSLNGSESLENLRNDLKQELGGHTHQGDFSQPKTRQPTSRNIPYNSTMTNNHQYPGMAVQNLNSKTNKSKNNYRSLDRIIPTEQHSDQDLFENHSLSSPRGSTERLNGQLIHNHHDKETSDNHRPSSAESGKSNASYNSDYDEWLAQVEMITHEGPARRLWMGPQFCFKIRQSTGCTKLLSSGSSALISDRTSIPISGSPPGNGEGYSVGNHADAYLDDDIDLQSLKIQTNRSDPMPTPKSGPMHRYGPSSVTIEAGSGSFDRTAHMLEIGAYGSLEDRRFVSVDNEDRLKERIADAMMEQYSSEVGKTRDIRSKSDSSDIVEFSADIASDTLLTVDQFDFDTDNIPSLETPGST
ncbi:BCAS3 microtubule associated cell migration factor-like isoform X1 [Styela clava]